MTLAEAKAQRLVAFFTFEIGCPFACLSGKDCEKDIVSATYYHLFLFFVIPYLGLLENNERNVMW